MCNEDGEPDCYVPYKSEDRELLRRDYVTFALQQRTIAQQVSQHQKRRWSSSVMQQSNKLANWLEGTLGNVLCHIFQAKLAKENFKVWLLPDATSSVSSKQDPTGGSWFGFLTHDSHMKMFARPYQACEVCYYLFFLNGTFKGSCSLHVSANWAWAVGSGSTLDYSICLNVVECSTAPFASPESTSINEPCRLEYSTDQL